MIWLFSDGPRPRKFPKIRHWKFVREDYAKNLSVSIKREALATSAKSGKTLVVGETTLHPLPFCSCTYFQKLVARLNSRNRSGEMLQSRVNVPFTNWIIALHCDKSGGICWMVRGRFLKQAPGLARPGGLLRGQG